MRFNPKLWYVLFCLPVFAACKKGGDDPPPPVVEAGTIVTKAPAKIGYFDAILEGEWTNFKKGKIYDFGFVWSTSPNPTTSLSTKKYYGEDTVPGKITYQLTDLKNGTAYYYRAFAIIDSGTKYGNEIMFSTLTSPWKSSVSFPGTGRQRPVRFSIGSKIYIGLGNGDLNAYYIDLWEFDPANKTWTRKADFPGVPRGATSSFVIGNKGYVVGGAYNYEDLWEYDPAADKWTRKSNLPATAYYSAAFSINGKGYVATGVINGAFGKNVWEYDPATDKWSDKASFPGTAVADAACFVVNGKGYVAGGDQTVGISKGLWEFDPVANEWAKRKDLPYETSSAVGFSINNKGYLGLGWRGGQQFWEYDPATDAWKKHLDFDGGYREGAMGVVVNNSAYVGLGTSAWTVYPTEMWEFTPAQ